MVEKEKTKQELFNEIADLRAQLEDAAKIEAAFRESKQRLTDIIDFLPDATFAIDLQGRIIAWNKAIETMTGCKADRMIGKGNYEYSLPFYGVRRPILIDLVLISDEEIARKYHFVKREQGMLLAEADISFNDRGERNLWGKAGPLYDSHGNMVGAIESIRDITDQRKAEKERNALEKSLRRVEKMKALGSLAGGVAHDLNNVIGVIIGYAELLMYGKQKQRSMILRLKNILTSAERAGAIVQDLLTLARRGVLNREVINLNDIVDDLLQSPEFSSLMTRHPHTRLHTVLDSALKNISGSSVHFTKSLFNLVSNALESMLEGGRLHITTQNQYVDTPLEGYDRIAAGPYAVLKVSDTGSGIAESDIQRIFEPFYSKK